MSENAATPKEVKREKIFIPGKMSITEVQKKYSLKDRQQGEQKKRILCKKLF